MSYNGAKSQGGETTSQYYTASSPQNHEKEWGNVVKARAEHWKQQEQKQREESNKARQEYLAELDRQRLEK